MVTPPCKRFCTSFAREKLFTLASLAKNTMNHTTDLREIGISKEDLQEIASSEFYEKKERKEKCLFHI